MFSKCVRSVIRGGPLWRISDVFLGRCFASFAVKDILYETSDEAGTLLARFAKHVALQRISVCDIVPTKVRYSDYFPLTDQKYFREQLGRTPVDQIASVLVFTFTYRSNADPRKFADILNDLDQYAVDNVHQMDADTVLRTLYAFLFLIPNWMTRLDFYERAMLQLFEKAKQKGCNTKEMFVQLCFYAGLCKQNANNNKLIVNWKSFLDSHVKEFLPQLSSLDLALVSNAAYKTSVPIRYQEFNHRLLREVLSMSAEESGPDALFISFIKSMRFQRVLSTEVCEKIAAICKDSRCLKRLQPRGQVHLLTYWAENLWDNKEYTQPIVDMFIEKLRNSCSNNYVERIRGKDLDGFLWCCAQLNCQLTGDQLQAIESYLLQKVDNNEFKYFPDQLVGCCLSLWILGFRSQELLRQAVQSKSTAPSRKHQPKVDSRFTVLLSSAQIESPSWDLPQAKGFQSFHLDSNVPDYLVNGKKVPFQHIVTQLKQLSQVSSATIVNPINGINLPGIHVKLLTPVDSQLFLEFIAPTQTLRFSGEPSSLLRLKLRLLQSKGFKVKLLRTSELQGDIAWNQILREPVFEEPHANIMKV